MLDGLVLVFLLSQVGMTNTSIDLTIEPRFVNVIKKLLRCEGVQYSTAILDIQVTTLFKGSPTETSALIGDNVDNVSN